MTFRNCLLAPANACNPSLRLQPCLGDRFRAAETASEALACHLTLDGLRLQPCLGDRFRAAETASEALACHLTLDGPLFLWRSETAFWHLQTLVTPRCASSRASETASEPQWLLQKSSHAISFWHPQTLVTPRCIQPCLGDRFRAAVTASEALACHLTLDGPLFVWRSETAFWHPQTLVTPRCTSSRASETASEPQRLLQKPSHAISPWTDLCLYDVPKLPFGTRIWTRKKSSWQITGFESKRRALMLKL